VFGICQAEEHILLLFEDFSKCSFCLAKWKGKVGASAAELLFAGSLMPEATGPISEVGPFMLNPKGVEAKYLRGIAQGTAQLEDSI
jgi:hypothetical protein